MIGDVSNSKPLLDLNRYLNNTTIYWYYEYNEEIEFNPNYSWVWNHQHIYTSDDLSDFVNEKIEEYSIKDIDDKDLDSSCSLKQKLISIQIYIFKKLSSFDKIDLQPIESVFNNTIDFIKKNDESFITLKNWNTKSLPDYTITDWKNFYWSLWSDSIIKLCDKLKEYNFDPDNNLKKIRETRNKFIEHPLDSSREIEFIDSTWNMWIEFDLKILCDWKYTWESCTITLSPMLDFAVFIDTFLEVTKILK